MTTRADKRLLTNHTVAVMAAKSEKPNFDRRRASEIVGFAGMTETVSSMYAASLSHCRYRCTWYQGLATL